MYLPHFHLSFREALFPCAERLQLMQNYLTGTLCQTGLQGCVLLTAPPGKLSWPHCLTISAVSACVWQCHECCQPESQEGKFYKCLSCHRESTAAHSLPGGSTLGLQPQHTSREPGSRHQTIAPPDFTPATAVPHIFICAGFQRYCTSHTQSAWGPWVATRG